MNQTVRKTTATCLVSLLAALPAGLAHAQVVSATLEPSAGEAAPPQADKAGTAPEEEQGDARPAHYEFSFVSVGAYQAFAIAGRWLYVGAGGGIGPSLFRYSKLGDNKAGVDPDLEIAFANAFIRVSPSEYLDIDVGPKIALGTALFNVKDPPQSAFSTGGYVDLRVGSRTVKVGPRFEYDHISYSSYGENGWRLTPLMLRIVH